VAAPIRIEVADRESATSLEQELFGRFGSELVRDPGRGWVVVVPAPENAPKHYVQDVLSAVERWLWIYGVDGVSVQLDGEVRALNRAATRRSGSAASPRRFW
jgi:hypothetical protein